MDPLEVYAKVTDHFRPEAAEGDPPNREALVKINWPVDSTEIFS